MMKFCRILLMAGIILGAAVTIPAQRGPGDLPDLVISRIDFQQVKSGQDSAGHAYWIFNVIVTVKNQGQSAAGPFDVTIERNNGAGGAWQIACQTCTLHVAGLTAGQEKALDPRQFNNANGAPSSFRATADSAHKVNETNRLNNFNTAEFKVIAPFGPMTKYDLAFDLAMVSLECKNVTPFSSGAKACVRFDLVATVKNNGPGKSSSCPLFFMKTDDLHAGDFPKIVEPTIPELASGASTVLTATGVVYEVGSPVKYFMAYIDYFNTLKEPNRANNMTYTTVPGY